VRVSSEEKEMRVFTIALILALTLTLFQYPERTKVATRQTSFFYLKRSDWNLYNILNQ
jgi:hypothetical protein